MYVRAFILLIIFVALLCILSNLYKYITCMNDEFDSLQCINNYMIVNTQTLTISTVCTHHSHALDLNIFNAQGYKL